MQKKKIDIVIIFSIATLISIIASGLKLHSVGALTDVAKFQKLIFPQIFRLGLVIGLGIFVYQGKVWAKWVASILFGVSGTFALLFSFTRFINTNLFVPLLLLGIFYYSSGFYFVFIRKWDTDTVASDKA